jgi:hypothetical protein
VLVVYFLKLLGRLGRLEIGGCVGGWCGWLVWVGVGR